MGETLTTTMTVNGTQVTRAIPRASIWSIFCAKSSASPVLTSAASTACAVRARFG
jgi:hypothetical protein